MVHRHDIAAVSKSDMMSGLEKLLELGILRLGIEIGCLPAKSGRGITWTMFASKLRALVVAGSTLLERRNPGLIRLTALRI